MTWAEDQEWEREWHGDCSNTFGEEAKQISYASRMGLRNEPFDGKWPVYDLDGRSVLDIGGGPVSMLLKTINGGQRTVADPCLYPAWVRERYEAAGITYVRRAGEELQASKEPYDECWLYNVLQHVQDPEKIITNARASAATIRIFEWIHTPVSPGHPHTLTSVALGEWLGATGSIEQMDENGAVGLAFYGTFAGASAAATIEGETVGG